MARRCDCAFLARLVAEHRLTLAKAHEVAQDLADRLVKRAYKLDRSSSRPRARDLAKGQGS